MSNNKSKEFAKVGMVVSLMVTTGTTFFLDNKKVKYLHITSGIALLGFSFWHHSLYKKEHGRLNSETKSQIRHAGERS